MIPGSYLSVIIAGAVMIAILCVVFLFLLFRLFQSYKKGHNVKSIMYLAISSLLLLLIIVLMSSMKTVVDIIFRPS